MAEEKEVKKGTISSQEVAVVNNIQALLNELLAMGATSDTSGQEPKENMPKEDKMAQKQEYMDDKEEMKEKEKAEKGLETTMSDGVTANDKAEERVTGDIPPESKDNMSEVAKAIEHLFNLKNDTQKSTNDDKIAKALNEMTEVVKTITERQNTLEKGMENILTGLGVADEIEKVSKSEEQNKPVRDNTELEKTVEYLAKALQGKLKPEEQEENIYKGSNQMQINKGITSWLPNLVQEDK